MHVRSFAGVGGRLAPGVAAGLLLSVLGVADAGAGESRIELRDGSVLSGELVGVGDGRYRVRTPVMGEIELKDSDVLAIRPMAADAATASAPPAGGADHSGDIADIQHRLVAQPGVMDSITALQNDPELQAALADPKFVGLVMSGNLEALRSDPRFLRLMEHPAIQGIIGRMGGQPGQ